MPSYPKLKLAEHIPANLSSIILKEGGEDDPMLQMPFTLRISGEGEAFVILVCESDEDGFYGYTLLYYQNGRDGWYRWLLERPDLPKAERWQKVDAPFAGLESAIGYEERAKKVLPNLDGDGVEAVTAASLFNADSVLPFGKYAGCTVRSVIDRGDWGYIRWAWDNKRELRDYFITSDN